MSRLEIPAERHELENGLRVVVSEDRTAPIVAVNLWYAVGSRNERPGRTGFAHLFEHMMFQGSQNVPKNRHFELVERAGGSLNATTWFDRTNYFETLPSHHLDLALWLEADRMGWMLPAMTRAKLDNQRDVVKNEKRQNYDNQPYGDWSERLQAMIYPADHPYHHPVIGSMEDLDAATLDDVSEFFRTFYVPNNCVLTVCGDVEPARAVERVEHWFGGIPKGEPVPPIPGRSDLEPILGDTLRERVVSRVPLPRTIVACRIPAYTDPAFHTADVLSSILVTGRASRLYDALVRNRRIAKDVSGYAYPLITGVSQLLVWATGYEDTDVGELEEAVLGEFDGLASVDAEEVERAVALTDTALVRAVERVEERADLLSMFETLFGDAGRLNTEMELIRAVTPELVRALAEARLGADNRVVLSYVPEGMS